MLFRSHISTWGIIWTCSKHLVPFLCDCGFYIRYKVLCKRITKRNSNRVGSFPYKQYNIHFRWEWRRRWSYTKQKLNGYIDEFCLHYGALNSTQVSSLYTLAPYYSVANQNASVWYADSECQWDYYSWASACTYYHQGGYNAVLEGSNPDYQWHLGNLSYATLNHIYWNQRIQDYNSFTLYFEIYVGNTSTADGLFAYVGQTNVTGGFIVWESGSNGGYLLDFEIYSPNLSGQGIYLLDKSSVNRAQYLTSGFIASAWQSVYWYYNKSTTNTWSCTWNGTSVWTYSDPNLFSWIATSGAQWGFGFRDGGAPGSGYIRHVQLFHK